MNNGKLKNYISYLEINYMQENIEDALKRNEQGIASLLHNEILDNELADTLRDINTTLARVARDVKRRRR